MIVWEPDKNIVRKAKINDLFEAVYMLTQLIPIGKVVSYKQLADLLGTSPRIVGLAMKNNTRPIIIPCHRVVGSNGDLKGYSMGGTRIKEKLLRIEGVSIKNNRIEKNCFVEKLIDP